MVLNTPLNVTHTHTWVCRCAINPSMSSISTYLKVSGDPSWMLGTNSKLQAHTLILFCRLEQARASGSYRSYPKVLGALGLVPPHPRFTASVGGESLCPPYCFGGYHKTVFPWRGQGYLYWWRASQVRLCHIIEVCHFALFIIEYQWCHFLQQPHSHK